MILGGKFVCSEQFSYIVLFVLSVILLVDGRKDFACTWTVRSAGAHFVELFSVFGSAGLRFKKSVV